MAKGLFIGMTTVDLIYYLPSHPLENSKRNATDFMADIGGPATNAAFTYNALGGDATLISAVGNHTFASHIRHKLEEYRINHHDLCEEEKTFPIISSVLINTSNGDRTVISTAAPHPISIVPSIDINSFDVILLDGFYHPAAIALLRNLNSYVPIVFDGGSFKPGTDLLLNNVDYPILASNFRFPDQQDPIPALLEKGKRNFAISNGALPIQVFSNGHQSEITVRKIEAADTLGAGDILHGAFAYFLSSDKPDFISALTKASEVATFSCLFRGTRAWVNHWKN